jgi:hypothetical protein
MKKAFYVGTIALLLILAGARQSSAAVALLMEEPYGELGQFDPAGHSAVYLNHICAETPTQLRMCRPGELGVVLSRYHKIHKEDWTAMPMVAYLYSVDDVSAVPATATKVEVAQLRETYWRQHLQELAPPRPDGSVPKGEWTQLVGASYDRQIHGFQFETTAEEDERFIDLFNDRRNVGHFNAVVHNCADFTRVVLDVYLPHSIHRNFIADLGITTPKQVAKSLVNYSKKHPELKMSAFVILQVPGDSPRSHEVDGVDESLVKSKKYLLPLIVLSPPLAGGIVVGYLSEGRMKLPKDATVFEIGDLESEEASATPPDAQPAPTARRPLSAAVEPAPPAPVAAQPVPVATPPVPVATPPAPAIAPPAPATTPPAPAVAPTVPQ